MKSKSAALKNKGISTAAREAGCGEGTMRSLDKRKIIHPIRDSAGRRLFGDDDVEAAREYLASRARAPAAV
jgi:DNA-binding transcriptional MerR regulator